MSELLLMQNFIENLTENGNLFCSDCRKLERDFPEVNAQKMIDQCIDLGVYCNDVWNTGGRWSMERLVWHVVSCFLFLSVKL